MIRSSYEKHDFGGLIKQYVVAWRPSSLVELGVLDGYSTFAIAEGIKECERMYGSGNPWPKLDAYDLFDDYTYKHGNQETVQNLLNEKGLTSHVNLHKGDAYRVCEKYLDTRFNWELEPRRGIEFLHIDISNTGKVIHDIMELWHPKIGERGLVLIEGGSEERDNVEWMEKYDMPSIKKEIETNTLINRYYDYMTYFQFPSLTVLLRKWYPA